MPLRFLTVGVPFAAAVADVLAVIVVLAGARDRHVARSFAAMAACMAVWSTGLGAESIPGFAADHPGLIRLLAIAILIVPAAVFDNAVVWSGTGDPRIELLRLLGYGVALGLCLLHWNGLVYSGFVTYKWGAMLQPAPGYRVEVVFSLVWISLAAFVCARALQQSSDPAARIRSKYWLLSVAVFFPLGLLNFLSNYGVSVVPPSGLGNIAMVAIMAYAAVRHRVMDIDRFIMRAAATLVASAAVVLPIAGTVIWAQELPVGLSSALVSGCLLLATLVSLLVFSRFRSYLEQEVERALFRARHTQRETIRQLSTDLVRLREVNDGGAHFTETLMEGLGLQGVALYLRKKSGSFTVACTRGQLTAPELLAPPAFAPAAAAATWEACVPVCADGSELGYIVAGAKRSGAAVDDSDRALLTLVANQLGIGLKNVEYVREIRRQQAEIEELRARLEAENVVLRSEVRAATQCTDIVGSSAALRQVLALAEKVAPTDASVLITGETGTGKELIARAIHELSPRHRGPLISVNCPAIPPELAESELFGHERGAFTGAVAAQPGKFELANGGTIFLDEVADLPLPVQVKLLRVLQEREVQRLGGRTVRKLDLRVVAATNRDLTAALRAQQFREDLYYRLAAVQIAMPSLRERTEDIPMLASFFLGRAARAHQRAIHGFTAEALAALCGYSWPGNVRELQNVIERAVLLCPGEVIRPEYLSDLAPGPPLRITVRAAKQRRIEQALAQSGGNHAAAARLLGITPSNLARLLKSLRGKVPPHVH